MRTVTRIGLVVAIPILIFCAVTASHVSSSSVSAVLATTRAAHMRAKAPPEPSFSARDDGQEDAAGAVDLYGNEVIDAVARYRFDGAGAPYELHSPQTEVPRLGSPKS